MQSAIHTDQISITEATEPLLVFAAIHILKLEKETEQVTDHGASQNKGTQDRYYPQESQTNQVIPISIYGKGF